MRIQNKKTKRIIRNSRILPTLAIASPDKKVLSYKLHGGEPLELSHPIYNQSMKGEMYPAFYTTSTRWDIGRGWTSPITSLVPGEVQLSRGHSF